MPTACSDTCSQDTAFVTGFCVLPVRCQRQHGQKPHGFALFVTSVLPGCSKRTNHSQNWKPQPNPLPFQSRVPQHLMCQVGECESTLAPQVSGPPCVVCKKQRCTPFHFKAPLGSWLQRGQSCAKFRFISDKNSHRTPMHPSTLQSLGMVSVNKRNNKNLSKCSRK